MRALKKKLKKIVLLVFTFFMTINNKIIRAMTIPTPQPAYGVREPSKLDILKIFAIPIVLAVGILTYIIMSKNSTKEKIILIIIIFTIIPLICYGLWHFIMSGVRV